MCPRPAVCRCARSGSWRPCGSRSSPRGRGRPPARAGSVRAGPAINPHTCRRTLRSRGRDPFPLVRADLLQRPPQRRVRGHRPEQLVPDPAAPPDLTAPGRRRRSSTAVSASTRPRSCTGVNPRRRNALRQRAGQPGPVGQQPQRRGPGVRHDPVPADFHGQIPRPRGKLIHLKGAPRSRQNWASDTLILPGQEHLSPFRHAAQQDRYELSGLTRSTRKR